VGGQSAFLRLILGLPDPHDEDTTTVRHAGNYLQAIQHDIPQDMNLQEHCCENFKPHIRFNSEESQNTHTHKA